MKDAPPLPTPPHVALAVARDRTDASKARGGFVDVRRVNLVATDPDGAASAPFAYDVVERRAIDAVVVAAYARADGERRVWLQSSTRAPIALRDETRALGDLWELPAGLVDPGETPRAAAARELHEELGFRVDEAALEELGPFTWPAPGFVAERHYYFAMDVTGVARGTPTEDGSALERGAACVAFPLATLLSRARVGDLPDAKTELALRRLAERA